MILTDNNQTNRQETNSVNFAVIGAGISGLTLANKMNALGYTIAVIEKARGTGGRLSSKRVKNSNQQTMAFDLGCTSFSGKSAEFKAQLDYWHQVGVLAPWLTDKQGYSHYVACSRNSSLTRYLSQGIDCYFSTQITEIKMHNGLWELLYIDSTDGSESRIYADNVVFATPSVQALALVPRQLEMKARLTDVTNEPQWVLAVEVSNPDLNIDDMSFPDSELIHSISIESNKPTREHSRQSKILQIQTTAQWSSKFIDRDKQTVEGLIIKELELITKQSLIITNRYLHRWLYSTVSCGVELENPYLWNKCGIGLIGDYFDNEHFGIEASWHSAIALVNHLSNIGDCQTSVRAHEYD